MKQIVSTISQKGQVTIPADVRRHLGVGPGDQVVFVLATEGAVELRAGRYTLDDVLGSLKALPNESLDLDREIAEAVAVELSGTTL